MDSRLRSSRRARRFITPSPEKTISRCRRPQSSCGGSAEYASSWNFVDWHEHEVPLSSRRVHPVSRSDNRDDLKWRRPNSDGGNSLVGFIFNIGEDASLGVLRL